LEINFGQIFAHHFSTLSNGDGKSIETQAEIAEKGEDRGRGVSAESSVRRRLVHRQFVRMITNPGVSAGRMARFSPPAGLQP
jgi:hypothetical protein